MAIFEPHKRLENISKYRIGYRGTFVRNIEIKSSITNLRINMYGGISPTMLDGI